MSARTPVFREERRSGTPSRRARGLLAVLLSLIVGTACASTGVDRSDQQTREGVLAADQGYWEEAEFRWRKALARDATDTRALNNLAIRFERLGEFQEAADYYRRALEAAGPSEHFYVEQNWQQFQPVLARVADGGVEAAAAGSDSGEVAEPPAAVGLTAREILVEVPDQGPNLAGYDRILIGNFAPADDSEANINEVAVRYFRRRITQRTFFETQDQIESPLPPEIRGDGLLADRQFWVARAEEVRADLVMTGWLGLQTSEESRMVRERIRSPDGQVREVARFQDSVVYQVKLDYVVLRGSDGETLLDGSLEAEQSFPADEGIAESEAVFEALEELLPQVLEAITPQRSEQSRYLIY